MEYKIALAGNPNCGKMCIRDRIHTDQKAVRVSHIRIPFRRRCCASDRTRNAAYSYSPLP